MNRKTLLSFVLISTFSGLAWGGPKKPAFLKEFPTDAAMTEAITAYPSEENFNQVMAAWGKMKRSPASGELNEGALSKDFKTIRDNVLAAKDADALEAELKRIDKDFKNLDPHAKYFAAQMLIMKDMRGIVWRLRPIVESGPNSSKATHSLVVSLLRTTRSGLEGYLPTDQWRAGFDYVTIPSKEQSPKTDQFQTVHDFQNWLAETQGRRIAAAASVVAEVLRQANADTVYAWDNQLSFGKGTFEDGLARYEGHGQAEMRATYAYMMFSLHNLYVACAYNMDKMAAVQASMGRLYGIDGFLPGRNLGVTYEDRVGVLNEYRNDGFFAIDEKHGREYMGKAYGYLKASSDAADQVYKLTQKGNEVGFALNPLVFRPEQAPTLKGGLEKFRAMVAGPTQLRSRLTGKTVDLDLPAFYTNPPASLLKLLPDDFEKGGRPVTAKNAKGETLQWRDYLIGAPKSWDNTEWAKYVPSAANKEKGYMAEANQILRTSIGSNYFWTPMGYYFN